VAHLHRPRSWRARQRDVAQGRSVEDRRRAGVGHRQLRPETNLAFFGTGNGGPWMGDQRPGDNLYVASTVAFDVATGRIKGPLPVRPQRVVGLGRGVAADPRGLSARRPHRERAHQRRARRLPVVPRAHRRRHQLRRGHALRHQQRLQRLDPKTGRPEVDPARKPGTGRTASSARRRTAARTGRPSRSARRRG
jgi:hypothetical protein